jgi:uncharacterized membrane protein YgcG
MITLSIQVPASRDRSAVATLRDGTKLLFTGNAAASATPAIAAAHGNAACDPLRAWGHPPTGTYQLLTQRAAKKEQAAEYGMHLLLFEPRSGQARDAESYGRLGLLVYGGPPDREKRLRRTQGGVRLSNEMLSAATKQLARGREMALVIEILQQPPWWKFWKRRVVTPPLSATTPKAYAPPLDEMSIVEKLLRGVKRSRPYGGQSMDTQEARNTSESRDRSQDSDYSSSSRSSSPEPNQGGGGQSAGAGASGGWDSAPATARGVDSAGRIVAGVAAGVAAGAALGALAHEAAQGRSDSTESSTTTHTSY